MHLASSWLQRDRVTVSEVAARLGYESEASFSRAFKRLVGVPPSALRRATLTPIAPITSVASIAPKQNVASGDRRRG
jgi:AraC-like DNA-binding protein